jgi:hypothetical protein
LKGKRQKAAKGDEGLLVSPAKEFDRQLLEQVRNSLANAKPTKCPPMGEDYPDKEMYLRKIKEYLAQVPFS